MTELPVCAMFEIYHFNKYLYLFFFSPSNFESINRMPPSLSLTYACLKKYLFNRTSFCLYSEATATASVAAATGCWVGRHSSYRRSFITHGRVDVCFLYSFFLSTSFFHQCYAESIIKRKMQQHNDTRKQSHPFTWSSNLVSGPSVLAQLVFFLFFSS